MEHVNQATTTPTTTKARYVGPSAARIAELLSTRQRVRFERGWFWTAALCHESEQDLAAFRQRPDGDGIDVRCKSAGCSRERIIRRLESQTGESIWSAYRTESPVSTPTPSPASGAEGTTERSWRIALAPVVVLLLAAPLVFGYDLQVGALNAFGLGWAGWLGRRIWMSRRLAIAKGGRRR